MILVLKCSENIASDFNLHINFDSVYKLVLNIFLCAGMYFEIHNSPRFLKTIVSCCQPIISIETNFIL